MYFFIESISRDGGQFQLFKTGSGRPVSVNKSSVDKARTLLEKQQIGLKFLFHYFTINLEFETFY